MIFFPTLELAFLYCPPLPVPIFHYDSFPISGYTDKLISWSRVLFEKLTVPPLVQKFPLFCGIWRNITICTRKNPLLVTFLIQTNPVRHIPLRSILISSNRLLGLPCGLFYSGLPMKILYVLFFFPITTHVPFHNLITIKLLANCSCAVGLRNYH